MRHTQLALVVVAALAGGACMDTDLQPAVEAAFAEFDPAGTPPRVPTPNDLARASPAGGIVPLVFLEGAPVNAAAVTSFSAPIDPATLTHSTVLVLDATTGQPLDSGFALDPDTGQVLHVTPPAGGWPAGHQIAIAVHGEVFSVAGEPVVAAPAFFFARAARPIATCVEPAPDCRSASPLLPLEQAIGLERLRQGLAPLFAGLEAVGIARAQVIVAWAFTVSGRRPAIRGVP